MKYQQLFGIIIAVATAVCCFLPWSILPERNIIITGMQTGITGYGKPGVVHIVLCGVSILCLLISSLPAKRINIFVAALNLSWAIRNILLMGVCHLGECPSKQIGIYLVLLFSIGLQIVSLFGQSKEEGK